MTQHQVPRRTRGSWVGLVPQTAGRLAVPDTVSPTSDPGRAARSAPQAATSRRCSISCATGIPDRRPSAPTSPKGSAWHSCWRSSSAAAPRVMLLDEPTRGLDYGAKHALAGVVGDLAGRRSRGGATRRTTWSSWHRPRTESSSWRTGEIVADGPTTEVVVASPRLRPAGGQDLRAGGGSHGGPGQRGMVRGGGLI